MTDDAKPERPKPFIYGYGSNSCSQFTDEYRRDREATSLLYFTWYQGLLTFLNFNRSSDGVPPLNYDATPLQVIEDQGFLRLYCAEHPEQTFVYAALALIQKRLKERGL